MHWRWREIKWGPVSTAGLGSESPGGGGRRKRRPVRVMFMTVVVLSLEWHLVGSGDIASDPARSAIPWAMLALSLPLALGVWVFGTTSQGAKGLKLDALWALLLGTVLFSVAALIAGAQLGR